MDEFEEYRARAYSRGPCQPSPEEPSTTCNFYLGDSATKEPISGRQCNETYRERNMQRDQELDDFDDVEVYSPSRKYSEVFEIDRAFSGCHISRKNFREAPRSMSQESGSDCTTSSGANLVAKGNERYINKSKNSNIYMDCSPISCLGQSHASEKLRHRSQSCSNRSMVSRPRDLECATAYTEWGTAQMRVRTHSMPTQNKYSKYRKRNAFRLRHDSIPDSGLSSRHSSQGDESDLDEYIRVRTFSTSSKGIINRGDSFKRRVSGGSTRVATDGHIVGNDSLPDFRARSWSGTSSEASRSSSVSSARYHRVVVLGAHDVGKTSIVHQFMTSEYMGNKELLVDEEISHCVSVMLDEEEAHLDFIDHTVTAADCDVYPSGDAYIVMFSVVDQESFDDAIEILHEFRKQQILGHASVILVANKHDVVKQRTVSKEDGIKMALHYDVKYTEVSTILNHKVDELLVGTLKQIRLKEEWTKKQRKKLSRRDSSDPLVSKYERRGPLQRRLLRGAVGRVLRQHPLFRSCDNLLIL